MKEPHAVNMAGEFIFTDDVQPTAERVGFGGVRKRFLGG